MKNIANALLTILSGGGRLFCSYVEEQETRNFKVYKILFFKIRLNTSYKDNFVYKVDKDGNKRQVTNRKELKLFLSNIKGKNNTIIVPEGDLMENNRYLILGNNNNIEIKESSAASCIKTRIFGNNNKLFVDKSKYFSGVTFRIDGENRKISVGKDCMFSYDINIWTGDGHPIYDLDTGERINKEKDVIIGEHVWIGRGASIHKGAIIPDGCVIGACSFVTKEFTEKNCIIAGTPAKIIKRNIRWER